jgi:hypothetical protein
MTMTFIACGSDARNLQPQRVPSGCARWVRRGAWHDEAALQSNKHKNEIVKPKLVIKDCSLVARSK